MNKVKVTIEHNGKIEVIETDFIMLMTGERDSEGILHSQPTVHNMTYEEITRTIALWGWVAINWLNQKRSDKE